MSRQTISPDDSIQMVEPSYKKEKDPFVETTHVEDHKGAYVSREIHYYI